MIEDIIMALRGLVARALVAGTKDDGQTQTVTVRTHEGVTRSGIEVLQPFGVASMPPPGAMTIVLAIGGDQGDMMALPLAAPGTRYGNLTAGQVVVYDAAGNRVALLANGTVEIHAATRVVVKAPELKVEGNIVATGNISDPAGSMAEMRTRYNAHTHGGPGPTPIMD